MKKERAFDRKSCFLYVGIMATNLREDFLKSVKEDSPAAFLRLIEQHVSILSGMRMMLFGECTTCSLLIDIICRLHGFM